MKNQLACIIRTYSNNRDIQKSVARALAADIGHILVVIKEDDRAQWGNVDNWLQGQINGNPGRITLLPMCEGYTWSSALNYGFDEVRRLNMHATKEGLERIRYVLNVSNEVLYTTEDVQSMVETTETDENIGAVGTSFQGRQDGNPVELGRSYRHPRNTMMLVRMSAYAAVGGFSPRCDQHGGQEDWDWLTRLQQMGHRSVMLDRQITLLIGRNYDQVQKEARERKALMAINKMNAQVTANLAEMIEEMA